MRGLWRRFTDERIAAAAPVCMVSTGFQGDCTCEQAALGKIGTDTVELSAAFAPRRFGQRSAVSLCWRARACSRTASLG